MERLLLITKNRHLKLMILVLSYVWSKGFPGGSVVKSPPANARDTCSIPRLGRFLGEGNGNPLQYSCLVNPMDRGALQATVHQVKKELDMTWQLKQQQQQCMG